MPRRRRNTLRGSLVRSSASLGLVFVVLAGGLVAREDGPVPPQGPGPGAAADAGSSARPLWEAAYSERYPGCVSMVLWPLDEVPVALVTRTPAGAVSRVPLDEVDRAPLSVIGQAHAIGACRHMVSSARAPGPTPPR